MEGTKEVIKTQVVLADDHQLFREGVKRIIELESDMEVVAECSDGDEVLDVCRDMQPDIVLMDINMPRVNGVEATQHVREVCPETRVIILSIHDDEAYVYETLRTGACGYLLKDMEAEDLIEAVRTVACGNSYIHPKVTGKLIDEFRRLSKHEGAMNALKSARPNDGWRGLLTRREMDVLRLMAEGRSNRSIGEYLFISEKTVKNHVSSVLQKMNVEDRTQAVVTAIKSGWIHLE